MTQPSQRTSPLTIVGWGVLALAVLFSLLAGEPRGDLSWKARARAKMWDTEQEQYKARLAKRAEAIIEDYAVVNDLRELEKSGPDGAIEGTTKLLQGELNVLDRQRSLYARGEAYLRRNKFGDSTHARKDFQAIIDGTHTKETPHD